MRKWILEETDENRILHQGDWYTFDGTVWPWNPAESSLSKFQVVNLTEIKTIDDRCEVIRTMLDEIKKG